MQEARNRDATLVTPPVKLRRIVLATIIGNLLEWYDFAIYAFVAGIIGRHFFPGGSETASLLASFATFGVGFLARPLGAVVIGRLGDARGRKPALLATIFLMALGTIGMAVVPDYTAIGAWAPALLVLCRLLQGFSAGGELGGSTAFLVEWAPHGRRGLIGSWQQTAVSGGVMLGSAVAAILTSALSPAQMSAWGWRLAFLLGGLLVPVGLWLRSAIGETPAFRAAAETTPDDGSSALRLMLRGCGFIMAWTTYTYICTTYMPTFTEHEAGLSRSAALWSNTIALVALLIATPLSGLASDRTGRKAMLVGANILFILLIYPVLLAMVSSRSVAVILPLQILLAIMLGMFTGTAPAAIAEIFPTRSRSLLMSVSYGLTIAIFGGFAPYIATWLIARTGSPFAPALYVIPVSIVTMVVILASRETAHEPLR